jgi:hypothetical protein
MFLELFSVSDVPSRKRSDLITAIYSCHRHDTSDTSRYGSQKNVDLIRLSSSESSESLKRIFPDELIFFGFEGETARRKMDVD